MAKNESIFQGWYATRGYRVEDMGGGMYSVYELDGGAFVRIATVRADSYEDAIEEALSDD